MWPPKMIRCMTRHVAHLHGCSEWNIREALVPLLDWSMSGDSFQHSDGLRTTTKQLERWAGLSMNKTIFADTQADVL